MDELAHVLITPYSLRKSRTGGIIGRLLAFPDVDLVAVRLYAPSDEFVDRYIETIELQRGIQPYIRDVLIKYINDNFRPYNRLGITNRVFCLLFRGENAIEKLNRQAVGPISTETTGDTIRGTYGDFILAENHIVHFEPAALISQDGESNRAQLEILAEFAQTDGGVFEHVVPYAESAQVETTLVILKPENFAKKSVRPGNMIDIISRTGLFIVGAKLLRLSCRMAEEFYGPLRQVFRDRLKDNLARELKGLLQGTFSFPIDDDLCMNIAELLKDRHADHEYAKIVHYMSGVDPATCPSEDKDLPGSETCLALLYQGVDAISKIRERLGSTDPGKAAPGTIRSDFGRDLMRNGAHASDSPESALRERAIVGLTADTDDCEMSDIIKAFLAESST